VPRTVREMSGKFTLCVEWSIIICCVVQITTDYNDDKDCSDCFALQHFNAGDQVLTACHCKLQLCSVIVV